MRHHHEKHDLRGNEHVPEEGGSIRDGLGGFAFRTRSARSLNRQIGVVIVPRRLPLTVLQVYWEGFSGDIPAKNCSKKGTLMFLLISLYILNHLGTWSYPTRANAEVGFYASDGK